MSNIYKKGQHRKQQMFFPPSIDEYVSDDNPVRAIDEYVELLDMVALGFTKAALGSSDGQPAYHPKLLLKIYIYGYLNKIRSSRKLETEIKRNIEMMWLCEGLKPSYKTIAYFRKDNSKALKKVFREFVLLCKDLNLISSELVAVDGAFLRANASKNKLIMKKSVQKDLKKIDEKIEAYLETLEFADKEEKREKLLNPPSGNKLKQMKEKKAKLDKDLALLEELGVTQYNKTDKDAKLMVKPAHNLMAYNTQIAVDDKFKFIIDTDISLEGNDSHQLHNMALQTKEITKKNTTIVADSGYYDANEIKKCLDDNIDIALPVSKTGQVQGLKGKLKKKDFTYDRDNDCYHCPNNQTLSKRDKVRKKGNKIYLYYSISSKICKLCPIKDKCLSKSKSKTILRWEYPTPKVKTTFNFF